MKTSSTGFHFQLPIWLDLRLSPAVMGSLILNDEYVVGELLTKTVVARLTAWLVQFFLPLMNLKVHCLKGRYM